MADKLQQAGDRGKGYYDSRIFLQITVNCVHGQVPAFTQDYGSGIARRRELNGQLEPVGAWRTIYGTYDEVTHLYRFESLAEMEKARKMLFSDTSHLERDANTAQLQIGATSKIMAPLPYSRIDEIVEPGKARKQGRQYKKTETLQYAGDRGKGYYDSRVFLQIVINCVHGMVPAFTAAYGSGMAHRRELNEQLEPVGAWRTIYGTYDEVTHLYRFESLAKMEKARKMLFSDTSHLERDGKTAAIQRGGSSKLMAPLPYSRIK